MFKLKLVSSITLLSLTILLSQPPLAFASTKQSDITQPLDNYSQLIAQQYNTNSEKRRKDSKPHSENLLARNQTDYIINAFETSGLTPDKATVSTSVKSITPRDNTYIILAYMTTNVIYHRLNENNRKVNNSCQWTDLHKLTLSTQDNSNKVVTEDKLLPEHSDDNNNSDTNDSKTITNAGDGISTQQALTLRHTPITARAGKRPILPNFMDGIRYALKWTDYPYNGDEKSDYNPSYPYNETDNCANFVSQSIHEGGAPYQTALSTNTKDPNLWTPNLILGHDTWTWSNAEANYNYMISKYYNKYKSPWVDVGDLIYTEWEGDGHISHAMIATQADRSFLPDGTMIFNTYISQKTTNRHNIPLSVEMAIATRQHPNVKWHGLTMKWVN